MAKQELTKDELEQATIANINKEYGDGAIFTMGSKVGLQIPCIPTGIYAIDYDVIRCGGIPRSRITEIFGSESSGKTTLALQTIAMAQKMGGKAAIVDAEHALDPNWMSVLGVDVDALAVSQPDYGEQALSITEKLIESCVYDIIVIDSVAALTPLAEINGEIGDSHMGLQARMMGQAMRKFTASISKSNAAIIFVNQIREKIGVTYGSNETTSGGRALRFYASLRLDVRRVAAVKKGEEIIGNEVKVKAAKNKVGAPFHETKVSLLFNKGFDGLESLLDAAVEKGVVEKSGSWYNYKGERMGQGSFAACDYIKDGEFEQEIREAIAKDK